jgi:hypothetical protein
MLLHCWCWCYLLLFFLCLHQLLLLLLLLSALLLLQVRLFLLLLRLQGLVAGHAAFVLLHQCIHELCRQAVQQQSVVEPNITNTSSTDCTAAPMHP